MASDDKKRALDAAIAKLEKDFGKGTVMKLGDPAAQVIWRWGLAAFRRGAWSRYMARNPVVRRRLHYI